MTYCVAALLDRGVVFASDSRTSAGVDNVLTYRKMTVFEKPGERVLVLLAAGNLGITQAVVDLLRESAGADEEQDNLLAVRNMHHAARAVGAALREIHRIDAAHLEAHNAEFNASFILGGQIAGEAPRLFMVYAAGNFIEATPETPYFQIGELKYGKPILDRLIRWDMDLADAAKCVLMSFDSTMRSNISVGPPIDLVCYRRDAFGLDRRLRFDEGDPYFAELRTRWAEGLRRVFDGLPGLPSG